MNGSQHRATRRAFFRHHGALAPWTCWFCRKPVRAEAELSVHHLDGDQDNNVKRNIKATHTSCHKRHHMLMHNVNPHFVKQDSRD